MYMCVCVYNVLKNILLHLLIDNVLKWKLSLVAAATEEELLVGGHQPQEAGQDIRAARGPGPKHVWRGGE